MKSLSPAQETLTAHIRKLVDLSEEQMKLVLDAFAERKIKVRQYILQAGDVCSQETFVVSGCLRACYPDEKGEDHVVQFALAEWWISDFYSLQNGTPARYNIDALEDSLLMQVEKKKLDQLLIDVPVMNTFFRIKMEKAFISLQERVLARMSKTVEERYLEFAKRYPVILQHVPQHQVASYLGMSPESLSRIRKNLAGKK